MDKIKPIQILEELVSKIALKDRGRFQKQGVPGEVIFKLSDEKRLLLQQLTSDDASELTFCAKLATYLGPFSSAAHDFSKLEKTEFDKKLKLDLRRAKDII